MLCSENIRRNSINFKYIAMFMCLIGAVFVSGSLGTFYNKCATPFKAARYAYIPAGYAFTHRQTTGGPGAVLTMLGLIAITLAPFAIFPQASDPPLASETEVPEKGSA